MFQEYEQTSSYAKLQGSGDFKKFIKKKTVYLGREADIALLSSDEDLIYISDSPDIQERHVKIHWDDQNSSWYITNLANRVIYVDKLKLKKNHRFQLNPIAAIKIDQLRFYFFQARQDIVELF
jgi:hypothetical protein